MFTKQKKKKSDPLTQTAVQIDHSQNAMPLTAATEFMVILKFNLLTAVSFPPIPRISLKIGDWELRLVSPELNQPFGRRSSLKGG